MNKYKWLQEGNYLFILTYLFINHLYILFIYDHDDLKDKFTKQHLRVSRSRHMWKKCDCATENISKKMH